MVIVAIADGVSIVVNAVIDNVTMWMIFVVVTDNNVLGIPYSHTCQILFGNLCHEVIGHPVGIMR